MTQTTKSRKKQKLFDKISEISHSGASLLPKLKVEALELWFSHAITRPYCNARSLDLVTSNVALIGVHYHAKQREKFV